MWVGQQVVKFHHGHDWNIVRGEVFHPLSAGACAHVLTHKGIQRVDVLEAFGMADKTCISLKQVGLAHQF